MADLTPTTVSVCSSCTNWERKVGEKYVVRYGYLPGNERTRQRCDYGYTCSCPAFIYRKNGGLCKHIHQVEGDRCRWGESFDKPYFDGPCPECGSETTPIVVMV
jgi:hypothetical protein